MKSDGLYLAALVKAFQVWGSLCVNHTFAAPRPPLMANASNLSSIPSSDCEDIMCNG